MYFSTKDACRGKCRSDQHCPQVCPFDPAHLLLSVTGIRTLVGLLITYDITLEQKSHSREGHVRGSSLTASHWEGTFRDYQISHILGEILFPSNLEIRKINIAKRQWICPRQLYRLKKLNFYITELNRQLGRWLKIPEICQSIQHRVLIPTKRGEITSLASKGK